VRLSPIDIEGQPSTIRGAAIRMQPFTERPDMKRVRTFTKFHYIPFIFSAVIISILYFHSENVQAFNNNNGRNLPFCDTTMTPSWDPPGIWYEWCGRRWFVRDNGGQKAVRNGNLLNRTFYQKKNRQEHLDRGYQTAVDRMIRESKLHRALKRTHRTSDIEITCDDMQKAYAYNSNFIESYAFPENTVMDMGVEDPEFTAPQHWTMPAGLKFSTLERKILDPKTTPYGNSAPEATHCLYVKSPNRGIDVYEYYLLDEDGLWSVGQEAQALNFSDYSDEEIMTLPLDIDTDYQSGTGEKDDWKADGDTTWYDDKEYEVDAWYYWSEAYGTLETPDDGPVEVIKIAYQWIWSQWEKDEASVGGKDKLVDFENGTEIYFYSKDGHQLMITLDSLGVETTGLIKPDMVYYQKVGKSGSSVAETQSAGSPGVRVFPNPTSGMIRFNQPTSFELFDVLGRRVLYEKNATQANLSFLPRGMYFIRPQKGLTQKLLIQK
jgi:hypothetical protein